MPSPNPPIKQFAEPSAASAAESAAEPAAKPRTFLRHLYQCAVAAALPDEIIAPNLPPPPRGRTVIIGAGKAGGAMAAAAERHWPASAPMTGLVITRYQHTPPAYYQLPQHRIEVVEASHPVPDLAGAQATRRIMDMVRGLTADDLVVCLISGGGSALLTQPDDGITLADKQRINSELLRSGANIGEMNCVRKHLSQVKGGKLAALCAPARVLTLAISDVPGDEVSVIASGPTVPDPSSCADAMAIIDRYRVAISEQTRARLRLNELETPKPGDPIFARCEARVIATPLQSLQAAASAARAAGVAAYVLSDQIQGESRDIGYMHAALARSVRDHGLPFARPCVILSGGETTVTVRAGNGRGGRAVEFLLGTALELNGCTGVWALAADTDGIDGTEEHAGAVLTPDVLTRATALGISPRVALDANDAYGFFAALGDLVVTGPTFTNVNDFRALLVL